jgi:hypothetical protein
VELDGQHTLPVISYIFSMSSYTLNNRLFTLISLKVDRRKASCLVNIQVLIPE